MKGSAKLIWLVLSTILLLASCSSTSWTTDPYKGYDKGEYVCAVGRGATMEEADVLYGVTMQEKGVTTVISVDLDEAERTIQ